MAEAVEVKPAVARLRHRHSVYRRTYLGFDVGPLIRIKPDLSDWKTGDYKPLKRWPSVLSRMSLLSWA
jgi:hypothetical protein